MALLELFFVWLCIVLPLTADEWNIDGYRLLLCSKVLTLSVSVTNTALDTPFHWCLCECSFGICSHTWKWSVYPLFPRGLLPGNGFYASEFPQSTHTSYSSSFFRSSLLFPLPCHCALTWILTCWCASCWLAIVSQPLIAYATKDNKKNHIALTQKHAKQSIIKLFIHIYCYQKLVFKNNQNFQLYKSRNMKFSEANLCFRSIHLGSCSIYISIHLYILYSIGHTVNI